MLEPLLVQSMPMKELKQASMAAAARLSHTLLAPPVADLRHKVCMHIGAGASCAAGGGAAAAWAR